MKTIARFRADLLAREGRRPITVQDVLRRLRMIEREGLTLATVRLDDAVEFLAARRVAGMGEHGFNNRAKALNAWLRWRDALDHNPLKLLKVTEEEYRSLSDDEAARVVRAIPEMPFHRGAAVALALGVGLRPSEAGLVNVEDLDFSEETLFVRHPAKRGKRRRIPIPPWVAAVLADWIAKREVPRIEDRGALICENHRGVVRRLHAGSLGRVLREEAGRVGVRCNWQIARHTVATRLLRLGFDIRYVQYYLGHINIKNTARYAEVRFEDVALRFRALDTDSIQVGESK